MSGGAPRGLALLLAASVVAGGCHSIDSNAFAHSPVSVGTLPFAEPVTYSIGPDIHRPVPAQNGLLGSYFAGAQYDRLDHQQIDPNVNFIWDGSGNPVISAPDGIDHSDGDFRLPDSWGIWSVVWEGYLLAPTDGEYLLRIHVNNGGWLETKDASGAIVTIINCAGGTGFEGDCDATLPLTAGPHYIRFSYFNNAPPSANAVLSWQPPASPTIEVVPTTALRTQLGSSIDRAFIYVHGTTGDYHTPGFGSLLPPIQQHVTSPRFKLFQYFEDKGIPLDAGSCLPRSVPAYNTSLNYPVTIPTSVPTCDSNDGIALNGILLDADVRVLQQQTHADKVSIMSDSGGGAIVRAYLAYAAATQSDTLAMLDGVFFIQGAQAGSFIPILERRMAKQNPLPNQWIVNIAKSMYGHDPSRPAFGDLTPGSKLYQYTLRADAVPNDPHYASIVGDVRLHVTEKIFRWTFDRGTFQLGDAVMLPGSDDPTASPPFGGERFLPQTIQRGQSSTQWVLTKNAELVIDYLDPYSIDRIAKVFALPETHFGMGRGLSTICVSTPEGPKILNQAVLDAVFSLDVPQPSSSKLGYGNVSESGGCP